MSQPESRLQRRIQRAIKKAYPTSWFFKVHGGPFQKAGVPDLVGTVEGLFFGLEVKRPGEDATELQAKTIAKMVRAGAVACVVRSPQEALDVIREAVRLSAVRGPLLPRAKR